MAKSELSNGNNNRNEKEVDVPTFQCVPNAQAVRTHVRNSWLCTTNPSSDRGGWRILGRCVILTHSLLIRTLTNRTRDSLGCSVLPRLSMLDSYVCVGSVLCNGMNRDMRKSLSGRKGHFIAYTDQNLQLHLMPPPQNVPPVDTIIYHLFRGTISPRVSIYLILNPRSIHTIAMTSWRILVWYLT